MDRKPTRAFMGKPRPCSRSEGPPLEPGGPRGGGNTAGRGFGRFSRLGYDVDDTTRRHTGVWYGPHGRYPLDPPSHIPISIPGPYTVTRYSRTSRGRVRVGAMAKRSVAVSRVVCVLS